MKIKIKDLVIFAGILVVIFMLIFGDSKDQVFNITPEKVIETRIEGQETIIQTKEIHIIEESKIVDELRAEFDDLRADLEFLKTQRDTFQIIQIQDTIISVLDEENFHLRIIIGDQDSIIVAQRYIINSKDTIIAIGKHDLKRVKRQRNISIIGNLIGAAVIIFKP